MLETSWRASAPVPRHGSTLASSTVVSNATVKPSGLKRPIAAIMSPICQ